MEETLEQMEERKCLPPTLLKIVATADDDRVVRAMESLETGDLDVSVSFQDRTSLIAHVTSRTTTGKRERKTTTHQYVVVGSEHGIECSCPDYEHRHSVCKHMLAVVMHLQQQSLGESPEVVRLSCQS